MPTMSPSEESVSEPVIIFGGGFDPITTGHLRVAQTVHRETGFPIWAMPCYEHRWGKEMASPIHRMFMIKTVAAQHRPWLSMCDFEIKNKHNGSMYKTISMLREEHPNLDFHILIGMDNANKIKEWDRGEELADTVPFIVVSRPTYEQETDWFLLPPHRYIEVDYDISSTSVREAIENGNHDWARANLDQLVWEYIQARKLYGYKEQ